MLLNILSLGRVMQQRTDSNFLAVSFGESHSRSYRHTSRNHSADMFIKLYPFTGRLICQAIFT